MITGVMASLAELEIELQRERKDAAIATRKTRTAPVVRPRSSRSDLVASARRMRESGEPMPVIAEAPGVSRATLYRTPAEET